MSNLIFIKVFALTVLFFLLSMLTRPTSVLASHKVFQDNFDDGDANGWIVTRNPCTYNGLPAEWKVVNNQLGIKINGGGCVTEITPSDGLWNSLGNNYIVEFDMNLVGGTDHNFAFRYTDPDNWYDFHIQSPGSLILQRVLNTDIYSNTVAGDFSNGQTIHFKIEIIGEHIKIFRGNPPQLILDYPDAGGRFPTGRIALQASAGADPNSETYFDNIVVTNIDGGDILPVPYFSQNTLPWGPTEYDHAASLGFSNTTMDRWGCAVTSSAMMLNYHNMNEFENGTKINPETLNNWLKSNNGFQTGVDKDGPFSKFVWSSINRLTKSLFNAGKAPYKLIHSRPGEGINKNAALDQDITNENPAILAVSNSQTDMHFVVAKGKTDSSYSINDPEWNHPDLTSFAGNTFFQLDRYLKSNTNFSYIEMSSNPSVEVLIIDPEARRTGRQIVDGQVLAFDEIPNAIYSYQNPISNPSELGEPENFGVGYNEFLLPEPANGDFTLTISSSQSATYTLNIASLEEVGTDTNFTSTGFVSPKDNVVLQLNYSQASPSSILNRIVTFQSANDDVIFAWKLELITKEHLKRQLIRLLNHAQEYLERNHIGVATHRLDQFERILNRERGDRILEEAYQILLYDVNYLKTHL